MTQSARRFYRAARVANARLDGWLPDHAVGVLNGVIVDVIPAADAPAAELVDLGGVSLLPGLVEGHSHIPCPPRVDAFDIIAQEADAPALMRAAHAVGLALRSGVTTMRDLGAKNEVVFAVREAIASGTIPGPRLLASGAPITRTMDHCWFWGGEADSPEAVRAMAQAHVDQGADVLKVMASGGNFTPTSNPRDRQYPPETIREIVETGRAGGIEVAAHTHAAEGIRAAVAGGVRHLIHCRWLSANPEEGFRYDPTLAQRIADEGIWVNPTIGLGLLAAEARERGDDAPRRNPNLQGPSPREQGLEILRNMREHGVRFTSGLDMGMAYADFNRAAAEAWAFVEDVGLSEWQALRIMTADTADAIGVGDQVGQIQAGKQADLAAFSGDPAANIRELDRAVFVMQGGNVIVGDSV